MHNRKLYNQIINSISKVVKKQINEAFEFNSVNKKRNSINTIDILIKDIVYRIIDTGRLDTKDKHFILSLPAANYKANNNEIHSLVTNCVKILGDNCNLNWIDVSNVTNMSKLFENSTFNGDISNWNVSNVTNMSKLFENSAFNGDISNWDVSNVTDMSAMFAWSIFNGDISNWDVSNAKNMQRMFAWSNFNRDISKWNVSNVNDMKRMFAWSNFNSDISKWNINKECNTIRMFCHGSINNEYKPKGVLISESFNFGSVDKQKKRINVYSRFFDILEKPYKTITQEDKEFIELLTLPDNFYKVQSKDILISIIEKYIKIFGDNCNLNWIDVSNITDMSYIFYNSKFNGDISQWNVSNVTNMQGMFSNSKFNGDISQWNISNVTNMEKMFRSSIFNGDISQWDVSNVTDMREMFYSSVFNGDISQWNVSNVIDMSYMFKNSKFNNDISKWNVYINCNTSDIFKDCPIKDEYKPKYK